MLNLALSVLHSCEGHQASLKAIKKYKCHATHQKTGGELFKLTPKTITSLGY